MSVVAVGRDDPVAFLEGLDEARRHGLLPDIDVEVAPDLTLPEALLARLLEGPDQCHPTVQIYEELRAGRYGTTVFAGLYAPVFRVLVICRHQRPLPSQRYKPEDRIPKPQVSYVFSYTLLYPVLRLSQPLPYGPERPRPVGVCIFPFAHLGVGHRRPLGDEHGIVAESPGAPRSWRQGSRNLTPESAHGPISLSERDD